MTVRDEDFTLAEPMKPTQPARRPLCFEDLWRLDRLGVPVPSPDGTRIVLPVTSVDWSVVGPSKSGSENADEKELEPENETRTDLWFVDLAAPRRAR